ncbi:hypothetical protein M406DRAFT_331702 [Cryphonectria parasitica EP155]|uniref:Uncharacterized protein n=1 Tax=Cryphonectria parasitica (strain ATCC 38755 / EP155) TaxID=660469 RepID=A0A9P4XY53_CRYP1|nr:uncharacterized protein M406DRAFT_331702 [Cryphonectria parasitica EP155]KAF3763153.1 hypothetical protein M406DRAFT_331702 [Cryphonectria parasitica EP155]
MKFLAAITAFGLISTAWAQTAVDTISTVAANLEETLPEYKAAINEEALKVNLTAVGTILTTAKTQIEIASINTLAANTQTIASALQSMIATLDVTDSLGGNA